MCGSYLEVFVIICWLEWKIIGNIGEFIVEVLFWEVREYVVFK